MKKCKNTSCKNEISHNSRSLYCSESCKKLKVYENQPVCESSGCNNLVPRGSDGRWRLFCSKNCKDNTVLPKQAETRKSTWEDLEKKSKILQKYKNTSINNTGVEHHMQLISTKNFRKQESLKKYGTEHHLQSPIVKTKKVNTCVKKYGKRGYPVAKIANEIAKKLNDVNFLLSEHSIKPVWQIAEELGVKRCWVYKKFSEHGITCQGQKFVDYSGFETEVKNFLKTINIKCISNTRDIISPYELDIYIPEYNLAIECNGSYWHSELNGKDKKYHITKTNMCLEKSVQLIHIWEHDWDEKKELVKSMILAKIKMTNRIYARKTVIRKVNKTEEIQFLNKNHLQGYTPSSHAIGLYYDDILVSILTLSKPRYNKKYEYEIIRYATIMNTTIVGGFSKLLNYFIKENNVSTILTYSDRMTGSGNVYLKNGFKKTGISEPAYYYTKNYTIFENRLKYQKHKLEKLLDGYNSEFTEWQNMQNNGFDRIWDCGNDIFVYTGAEQ